MGARSGGGARLRIQVRCRAAGFGVAVIGSAFVAAISARVRITDTLRYQ